MHIKKIVAVVFVAAQTLATAALAGDITTLQTLSQAEFKRFGEDLTAGLSYKAVAPATPLGITGFDVGVGFSAVEMKQSALWNKATGSDTNVLPVPKLFVSKGLPFGIDIGASYTAIPSTNIKLYGAEIKYAILEGSTVTPALAVRAGFTRLDGVDQLDFSTQTAEIVLSKGFLGFTPYVGAGYVRGRASAHLPSGFSLASETLHQTKLLAGVNWNILLGNLAVEFDRTGDNNALTAKLGIRW